MQAVLMHRLFWLAEDSGARRGFFLVPVDEVAAAMVAADAPGGGW